MKALILAGGIGRRLWPISRRKHPKQIKKILGDESLLSKTFNRLSKIFDSKDIFISTNYKFFKIVKAEVPKILSENIILEPELRENAPAIGLGLIKIKKKFKNDTILICGSDSFIKNEKEFVIDINIGMKILKKFRTYILLLVSKPTYPETGYGYIKIYQNPKLKIKTKNKRYSIYKVEKFVEKPSLKKAKEYLKSGNYFWNSLFIISQIDTLLKQYKEFLPRTYASLSKISKYIATDSEWNAIKKYYKFTDKISIDYGILEKCKNLLAMPCNFGWVDIGHWRSIQDVLRTKQGENIIKGIHKGIKTKGCLIYSDQNRLIATCGIRNLIIIDTKDALLICSKSKAQEIKQLVKKLEQEGYTQYL